MASKTFCWICMEDFCPVHTNKCKECERLRYILVEKSVPLEQYEHAEKLLRRAKDVIGTVAETGNPDWELLQEINSLLEDGEPTQTT